MKEIISVGVSSLSPIRNDTTKLEELGTDRKGYTYWETPNQTFDVRVRVGAYEDNLTRTINQLGSGRFDTFEDDTYKFTTEQDLDTNRSTILVFHPKDVPEDGVSVEMLSPLVNKFIDEQGAGVILQAVVSKEFFND